MDKRRRRTYLAALAMAAFIASPLGPRLGGAEAHTCAKGEVHVGVPTTIGQCNHSKPCPSDHFGGGVGGSTTAEVTACVDPPVAAP